MSGVSRVGSRSAGGSIHSANLGEVDVGAWVQVDADALVPAERERFMRRKRAIQLYLDGASPLEIRRQTGQSRSNVYRLIVDRCLQPHEDGELFGWRGALPFLRVNRYVRHTKPEVDETGAGASGALHWLFSSPDGRLLEQRFRERILKKATGLEGPGRSKQALFRWVIAELRTMGYERRGEWPFNVEKMGFVTFAKFIDRVLAENPQRQRILFGGEEARRKAIAGDGTERPELALMERVECDAHKLDIRMMVKLPSPHGGFEDRKIHRLWVIVILEVVSRLVLGYHLSLRRECSAEDVLQAVKRALTPWTPRQIHFSKNAYVEGAGMPSVLGPEFVGACWSEFSVDGALANVCGRVASILEEVVGCRILKPQDKSSYTSRRSKDDRPFIESFFNTLARGGFHRLAPTTGSRPVEKRGRDPDVQASETQFQLEYAEELLDTLIANYNATPHSGLGYRSPLAQALFLARQGATIRHAIPDEVRRMVGVRRLCTLLGGAESGRRPHFHFANARYSAEWLSLRVDLLGKNFWLQIENEDDARWATVSDPKGLILGVVRAGPPWHRTPHSLYIRQSIRALEKRRMLHLSSQCDAVEELIRYAESTDGKLAPHPAYLQARRILQERADSLQAQPWQHPLDGNVEFAPDPDLGLDPLVPAAEAVDSSGNKPKRKILMPQMRMAKTW